MFHYILKRKKTWKNTTSCYSITTKGEIIQIFIFSETLIFELQRVYKHPSILAYIERDAHTP